jgi:hypothetical protein
MRREIAKSCVKIVIASEAKQSNFLSGEAMDCFAALAMTLREQMRGG